MKSSPVTVVIILIAAAGAYFYFELDDAAKQETQTAKTEPLQIPEDTTPEIQHPITESPVIIDDPTEETSVETESYLEESDNKIKEILSSTFDNKLVNQIFQKTGIINHFVVTIDALPKKEVPIKYRLLPPTPGKFLVHKDSNDKITLDPENFKRYDIYMQMLNKVEPEQFVKWYKRFYPLIQEEYDSLGYNNRYFNDRFIFVIDHLLEMREAIGAIQLVQPSVFYKFADPALQKLSAGQKILLRIGSANRVIVKDKLVEVRKRLATPQSED
jgi:hypothetical protein